MDRFQFDWQFFVEALSWWVIAAVSLLLFLFSGVAFGLIPPGTAPDWMIAVWQGLGQ